MPTLVPHVRLEQLVTVSHAGTKHDTRSRVVPNYDPDEELAVGNETFAALARADGKRSLATLTREAGLAADASSAVLREVLRLWERRVVKLTAEMSSETGHG